MFLLTNPVCKGRLKAILQLCHVQTFHTTQPVRTAALPALFWWMASARAGYMAEISLEATLI